MPLIMCPNCNASMQEVKREDVSIDMCPACRGVWLDRGELEKLLSGMREVSEAMWPGLDYSAEIIAFRGHGVGETLVSLGRGGRVDEVAPLQG